MPQHKSAIKRMRQDKKKRARNRGVKTIFKKAIKQARKEKTDEALKNAYSALDKAAKKSVIHKNTAVRKKSRLAKFLNKQRTEDRRQKTE